MSDKVTIREVGLRDGLQIVKGFMPTDTKLAWIAAEHATVAAHGIDEQ